MVNTVASYQSNYSNQDYLRAVQARELQIKIGRPSIKESIKIVTNNLLPDCLVTKADNMEAEDIFGPEVEILKGKTMWHNPHTLKQVVEPWEPSIMRQYRHVTLGADVMFVNRIPFLVTVSRHIKFGTGEPLVNRKQAHLLAGIRSVAQIYQRARFKVTVALMDGEFKSLQGISCRYEHLPKNHSAGQTRWGVWNDTSRQLTRGCKQSTTPCRTGTCHRI